MIERVTRGILYSFDCDRTKTSSESRTSTYVPDINSPVVNPSWPMFSSEIVRIDRPSVPSLIELRSYSVMVDLMDYWSQHVPCK